MNGFHKAQVGDIFSFTHAGFRETIVSHCIIIDVYKHVDNTPRLRVHWLNDYAKNKYDSYNYKEDHFQGQSWRKLS